MFLTVNSGKNDFCCRVEKVFEAARRNAPTVIFIDDADVIFEDRNQALHRYLLTMLDVSESASSERVCVMMTAMNAGTLPRALLPSDRIELWLSTGLSNEEARAMILRAKLDLLPSWQSG